MKTNSSLTRHLAAALALTALSAAPFAKAGPGITHWTSTSNVNVEIQTPSLPQTPLSGPACKDAKVVQVTETKKEWPNARGPLTTVAIGSKVVCTSCIGAATVPKLSWSNGKGPLVSTPVAAQHDCVTCGTPAKI